MPGWASRAIARPSRSKRRSVVPIVEPPADEDLHRDRRAEAEVIAPVDRAHAAAADAPLEAILAVDGLLDGQAELEPRAVRRASLRARLFAQPAHRALAHRVEPRHRRARDAAAPRRRARAASVPRARSRSARRSRRGAAGRRRRSGSPEPFSPRTMTPPRPSSPLRTATAIAPSCSIGSVVRPMRWARSRGTESRAMNSKDLGWNAASSSCETARGSRSANRRRGAWPGAARGPRRRGPPRGRTGDRRRAAAARGSEAPARRARGGGAAASCRRRPAAPCGWDRARRRRGAPTPGSRPGRAARSARGGTGGCAGRRSGCRARGAGRPRRRR